jgi:RNA polymerase sigma-70 factor, ECF subfamily
MMVSVEASAGDRAHGFPALETAEFETVYVRHYRDVYRYVLLLTRSHDEAEDVTAETFERALRVWQRDGLSSQPLPWLLLSARRLATDRWRRTRKLLLLNALMARGERGAHESRTEFWLWFNALAQVLTPRQREVLVLRYQRDLNDEQIGSVMGLSASGVRSLVARALETLRNHPELL